MAKYDGKLQIAVNELNKIIMKYDMKISPSKTKAVWKKQKWSSKKLKEKL
jgi:hypothetical protein